MLLVVVLGLASAAVYGVSDFLGASASKRLNLISATTANFAVAFAVILIALPIVGGRWSGAAVWTGVISGILATIGLLALYGALAVGPMSLLAPVIALIQSIVPITISAATGQGLKPVAWVAIGIAVVAILLLAPRGGEKTRITARAGLLALLSGVTLGGSLVALDFAPTDSGIVPAAWTIGASFVVMLPLLAVWRIRPGASWLAPFAPTGAVAGMGTRRAWIEAGASGALTAVADAFIVTALHIGNLAVVSVLVALYPVATLILAAAVLRERIAPLQYVGIGLVIVASLLLAAA